MTELINSINTLIDQELVRACGQWGSVNASDHESYAVCLEELEEATAEVRLCISALHEFWEDVKDKKGTDSNKITHLKGVRSAATLAACEFIQVAAMADKAMATIKDRGGK